MDPEDEFTMDEGDDDDEFTPTEPPPPETGLEYPGGDDEFTPTVMAEAAKLDDVPAGAIIMEIVRRALAIDKSLTKIHEWTTSELVSFGATIGSLKSSRMRSEFVGSPVSKIKLGPYSLETLKARLVRAKITGVGLYTDSMLAAYAMNLKGAVLKEILGGNIAIVIPGCPVQLEIANRGEKRGRVTAGGLAFIEWHNGVYNSNFIYMEIGEDARIHARYARSVANIGFSGNRFTFVERPVPKKGEAYFERYDKDHPERHYTTKLGIFHAPLRNTIAKAFAEDDGRTTVGHSQHPLEFLEVILHNKYRKMGPKSYANVKALTLLLQQEYSKVGPALTNLFPKFFSEGFKVVPGHVNELLKGGVSLPDGSVAGSFGAVASFVEHSRALRAPADLMRKSDAYGMGVAGNGTASVVSKACIAIDAYKRMVGLSEDKKVPNVDAFGTHACNHWEQVVIESSSNVVFYDKERKWIPSSGVPFQEANIEALGEGTKKGRILFDDTLGCDGDFDANDGRKYPIQGKLDSVVKAGYEGGFIKMYYGNASDSSSPVGKIPLYLESFHKAYPRQVFVQGGSPHSPEWFLVFAKSRPKVGYPQLVLQDGSKGFSPTLTAMEVGDLSLIAYEKYARQWLMWKCYDMIRANILLNVQVLFGYQKFERLPSWIHYKGPTMFPMNGHIVPSSRYGAAAPTGAPTDAFTMDE